MEEQVLTERVDYNRECTEVKHMDMGGARNVHAMGEEKLKVDCKIAGDNHYYTAAIKLYTRVQELNMLDETYFRDISRKLCGDYLSDMLRRYQNNGTDGRIVVYLNRTMIKSLLAAEADGKLQDMLAPIIRTAENYDRLCQADYAALSIQKLYAYAYALMYCKKVTAAQAIIDTLKSKFLIDCTPLKDLFTNASKDNSLSTTLLAGFNEFNDSSANESLKEETDIEETVDIDEKIEKHDELNPKLFDGNKLKAEVKDKILELVDLFQDWLADEEITIDVKDIVIVGSNASYNYTEDSDLDIHILTGKLDPKTAKIYDLCRSNFNSRIKPNYDGIPAEVYVEAEGGTRVSNGCYSVLNDEWVSEPKKDNIPEVDEDAIAEKLKPWEERFNKVNDEAFAYLGKLGKSVETDTDIIDNSPSMSNAFDALDDIDDQPLTEEIHNKILAEIDSFIDDAYALRAESMQGDGEYGEGNLLFKEIRNNGWLDQMKDLKNRVLSKELSVEDDAGYFAGSMPEPFKRDEDEQDAEEPVEIEEGLGDLFGIAKRIATPVSKKFSKCMDDLLTAFRENKNYKIMGATKNKLSDDIAIFIGANDNNSIQGNRLLHDVSKIVKHVIAPFARHCTVDTQLKHDSLKDNFVSVKIKPDQGWLRHATEGLEENYLTGRELNDYRIRIQRLVHEQPLIQENGMFEINNVSENDVNQDMMLLRRDGNFEQITCSAGRFDFSHPNPLKRAQRVYTIRGKIKF